MKLISIPDRSKFKFRRTSASSAKTQFPPSPPQFLRLENSHWRDDARDQFRRGHVESRIPCATRRIAHANVNPLAALQPFAFSLQPFLNSPCAEDFAFVPFLNRNVEAAFQIPINRRKRNRHVKWNAVSFCQNRFGVSADFVRNFAGAAECAVAADNDQINFAALHQVAGGVVSDDLMRNSL